MFLIQVTLKASTNLCHLDSNTSIRLDGQKVLMSWGRERDFFIRKSYAHQDEDGEEYDNNGGCDEELLSREHASGEEKHQGETDGATEPSVGNDELVLEGQGNGPEPVNHLSQDKDTYGQREIVIMDRDRPGTLSHQISVTEQSVHPTSYPILQALGTLGSLLL